MKQSGFNPNARWDRHIPQDTEGDPAELNARIDVLAWFKHAKIYPRLIVWNNKAYKVKSVTYYWQERRGQEVLNCFTVDTGATLYQISFNNTSLVWRIDKIIE